MMSVPLITTLILCVYFATGGVLAGMFFWDTCDDRPLLSAAGACLLILFLWPAVCLASLHLHRQRQRKKRRS